MVDKPSIEEVTHRSVTPQDFYHLYSRWNPLIIYNRQDLNPRGEKTLLESKDLNKQYQIFHCGSCLVGAPKNLVGDYTRADAIQAAQVMARIIYKKFDWLGVEFEGNELMASAAWVQFQRLMQTDQQEKKESKALDILYTPTQQVLRTLYLYLPDYKYAPLLSP